MTVDEEARAKRSRQTLAPLPQEHARLDHGDSSHPGPGRGSANRAGGGGATQAEAEAVVDLLTLCAMLLRTSKSVTTRKERRSTLCD
jgi:hypothetical protein